MVSKLQFVCLMNQLNDAWVSAFLVFLLSSLLVIIHIIIPVLLSDWQIAPTDEPLLQPSAKPSTAVDSFWYVGIGWCPDANGFFYDSYLTLDKGSNADCSNACVGINSNELMGFTWKSSHKQCYCFFNDGFVTSNLPSGFSGYYDDDPGNGEVTFTSQDLGFDCYKLVRNLKCFRLTPVNV